MRLLILIILTTLNFSFVQGQALKKEDSLNWINTEVYQFHQTRSKLLGLDTSSKFDSLRIRIFFDRSLYSLDNILELSYSKQKWNGRLINYHLGYDQKERVFFVNKIKRKKVRPNVSWNILLSKLIANDLLILYDSDLLGEYPLTTDGVSFCVEISTLNSTRFYCYTNPFSAKEEIKEAQKMNDILDLLYAHFPLLKKY